MSDINIHELHERMQNGEKLNIIDVREPYEFEEFNIGATLIPLNELPSKLAELSNLKDQEVIVHCRSGARSNNAKMFMMSEGFTNVRNLIGGMMAWQAEIN
ncbi:MAG: rhodanese-like domain-containing protein [Bacteroidia bacterium]|nr:rhodanese-like domain-containing protein [Bacteroidia bacterium]MCF8425292.1 rhodanese-like domain-containing protein [Bacteroidia bacterium]MCF8446598.1 rhodanese-like domain-containing protein [Bacteroidia bacterium]